MGSVHVGYKFDMSKVARHVLFVTRSPGSKSKISTLDCTTYDREDAAGFKVSTKKAAAGGSQDLPKLRMGLPTTSPKCARCSCHSKGLSSKPSAEHVNFLVKRRER